MTAREDKEKDKMSRENLGKFFYDLAKTSFATMVVANIVTIFFNENPRQAFALLIVGTIATVFFCKNSIRSYKKVTI